MDPRFCGDDITWGGHDTQKNPMYPILFIIGPLTIYSFGFMLAIAVVVCSYLMSRDAEKIGIVKNAAYDFAFWVALAGVLGSRLFYIVLNLDYFIENPSELLQLQHGGLAWQGGLILGGISAYIYLRKKNLPVLKFLDLAVPYAALGQAIGRIGCFLNGCCYGKPVAWGLYFPVHDAHLHPTQIYESIGLVIVFFILKFLNKSRPTPGRVLTVYFMLAASLRFTVQFFRYDDEPAWMGLGIFQWICLAVFTAALVFFFYLKNRSSKAS